MGYGTSLCSPPYPPSTSPPCRRWPPSYKAKIETPHGLRTCFEARVHRNGKPDLVARFGGIPLLRDKGAVLADRVPGTGPPPPQGADPQAPDPRCELCEQTGQGAGAPSPQARQPRGTRAGQPAWAALMARPNGARPSWSAPLPRRHPRPPRHDRGVDHWRATYSETGPRGSEEGRTEKELPPGEATSPCGLSCPQARGQLVLRPARIPVGQDLHDIDHVEGPPRQRVLHLAARQRGRSLWSYEDQTRTTRTRSLSRAI